MSKWNKRATVSCLSGVLLCIFLFAAVLPLDSANAANVTVYFGSYAVSLDYGPGDYFTDDHGVCTVHYTNTPCKDTYNGIYLGARQCYGYARYIQQKLFGVNEYTNSSKFYDVDGVKVSAGNLTANKLKEIMTSGKVQPGAHLRTNATSGSSAHSMVITQITSTGFSVIQCNGRNNKEYANYEGCRIGTVDYTWASYVADSYGQRGIDFIKMPYDYKINPLPGPTTTPTTRTENAAYSAYVPFSTYAISTGKVTVYDYDGNAYSQNTRYIDGNTDLCVIQKVYTDGFCEVKYPSSASSSGYNTALAKLSDFISSPSPSAYTANDTYTAYRRSSGTATIGSVYSGDKCLKVASANGRIQVIYPAGSSHKMGWIAISNPVTPTPVDESYKTPCKSYPISTGHISVYAQAGGSPEANRYIDGSTDLCTIEEIYTNGWCKVTYPSGSATRTAYTQTSQFIAGSLKTAYSATANATAYRRSTGGETVGSVDAGDRCVKVAEANGRIQLMYPVSGTNYYKMGWIDTPSLSPQGAFDEATGGLYSVSIRGWAFDRDNLNQALTIQVYAGNTLIGTCVADQSRTDVNNAYPGVGNYHGFSATFNMSKYTGSQSIKVVAVNVGSGSNTTLGTKTVTVASDTTKPTISNVKVSNVSTEGYTITCTVTDDHGVDRVQFPTWTTYNGQDDIFSNWQENTAARGTVSGNTYTYRVLTSAHNGETGTYQTHIYAYDIYGNSASYTGLGNIVVPTPVDDIYLDKTMLNLTGLNVSETLIATIKPSTATDKTVTWKSSNTSVATVSNGKVTSVGFGNAEITATASNGISAVCTVFVLRPTYIVHYDANGGTGAPADQTKTYGVNLTLSSTKPTYSGHTFQGWATSKTGSVVYNAGGTYSANEAVTLYAVWKVDTYTVHYDANGGAGAPADQTKTYGVNLMLSSAIPTFQGHTFQGWATSSTGSVVYSAGGTYTANAAVTLYAVWKADTYTVHYDANGGAGAPADQTKTYGVNLTLSSAIPTFQGHTFQGWATSSTGGVVYSAGGTYTANAAVILYAVWENAGIPVTGFQLKNQYVTVEVGKQATLEPVFTPANATNKKVAWSSPNTAVATIDENGTVTGISVGTAMIKAVCDDNGATVYARITVKKRAVLHLPDGLIEISAEAFAGDTAIEAVEIGNKTVRIGSSAFKGCTALKEIWIPATVTDIATNAFDGCPNLTIHCQEGSIAWEVALLNGIPFETDM